MDKGKKKRQSSSSNIRIQLIDEAGTFTALKKKSTIAA